MLRSSDFVRRIIAPAGGQGGVTMSHSSLHCNRFPSEDYARWVSPGKKCTSWWCAICGEKFDRRAPNRLLVVPTGESAKQARSSKCMQYFRAHVGIWSMQSLCENLTNALELLANQQEDGDAPKQCIVTGLCDRSRKGLTEGLRN